MLIAKIRPLIHDVKDVPVIIRRAITDFSAEDSAEYCFWG